MQSAFSCTMCGICCQGEGGIILSPHDVTRLAAFLGQEDTAFKEAYAMLRNGKFALKSGLDGYCIFYLHGNGCSVHTARPDVCRAWPYFRGNLVDAESLSFAKADCEGIAPHVSLEDFAVEGYTYLTENKLISTNIVQCGRALCVEKADLPAAAIERLKDLP